MEGTKKWEEIIKLDKDIKGKARKWSIDGYERDDLEEELRLKLFTALDEYTPGRASIRTYANVVMNNFLCQLYRDNKRNVMFRFKSEEF